MSKEKEKSHELVRRGLKIHETNPFMPSVETRQRRVMNQRGDMMLVQKDTGEIKSQVAGFWEIEEVDSSQFIKLFATGIKALKGLSPAGVRVFELFCLRVQETIGKDRVYMGFSGVDQKLTPMSIATYTRGMREMMDKGFLAPCPAVGIFWINPAYIWNGDRMAFVKEYRKREKSDLINGAKQPQLPGFSLFEN